MWKTWKRKGLGRLKRNKVNTNQEETYKPFTMALKTLFIENLDSNWKRFEANPDILINVALINSSKSTFPKNVIRAKTLGDSLELIQSEGYNMSIKKGILSWVLKVAWSWSRITQIWNWPTMLLAWLTVFNWCWWWKYVQVLLDCIPIKFTLT